MKKIQNPKEILSLIRNHYRSLYSFSCNSTRTYLGVYTNTGMVKFKQPNKVKIHGIPLTVCDGNNEFYYNELEKTVWIAPVPKNEDLPTRLARTGIGALTFLFDEELFEISRALEDEKKYRLEFIYKSSKEPVGEIEVDKANLHLISWQIKPFEISPEKFFEKFEGEVSFEESQKMFKVFQEELYKDYPHLEGKPLVGNIEERYSDWKENIQIEDSEFEFVIPEGTEVKKVERIGCDIVCRDLFTKKVK